MIFGDDFKTIDGTAIRDYVHVVDLARGHLKVLEFMDKTMMDKKVEIFNFGSGEGFTVLQIIN